MDIYFEYLKSFDGPVIEGRETDEVVFAKDQPEYNPLRAIVGPMPERPVLTRWTLTDDQRKSIYHDGCDIYLTLLTFGEPLQPIKMAIG